MSASIVADCEYALKHWPSEKDYGAIGGLMITRYCTQYPEYHQIFPRLSKVPLADLPRHPATAALGIHKMVQTKELLMAKGKHDSIAKPVAILHITRCKAPLASFQRLSRVMAEVMGEKCGLDPAGQHAFRKACNNVWDDFERTYREMGIPA